ncbi:MAG: hypothetical protein AAFQ63_09070 [Cyanobacteria bacterium J06621_11]
MVWDYLGKLSPSPEWQRFDISSLDDSLIRITHSYNAKPIGFAYLSSVFSDGSRGLFRRLYPYKEETRVLEYEVSNEFREAGFNFRVLELKVSPRARLYDLSWSIEIEIWSDDVIADGGDFNAPNTAPPLDGGTYP